MTVHKAKGLEFPVVILADITCGLSRDEASALSRLGARTRAPSGWRAGRRSTLSSNNEREARRDEAEGVRLAYVAATRARDLLVVPAVGDAPFDEGWVGPLNAALYPPVADRQSPASAAGDAGVQGQGHGARAAGRRAARPDTVRPGAYQMADPSTGEPFTVVWWDPLLLDRPGDDTRGLRRDDLIAKDARPEDVAADRARYDAWRAGRAEALQRAARPSLDVVTATEYVGRPRRSHPPRRLPMGGATTSGGTMWRGTLIERPSPPSPSRTAQSPGRVPPAGGLASWFTRSWLPYPSMRRPTRSAIWRCCTRDCSAPPTTNGMRLPQRSTARYGIECWTRRARQLLPAARAVARPRFQSSETAR